MLFLPVWLTIVYMKENGPMASKFGELLRRIRKNKGKSMGDVARHLVVSVPYISDVERGYRPPLTEDRIQTVAKFFSTDPKPLLEAAAQSRSQFRLDATAVSSKARQVGAALERRWSDLSEDELRRIERIVEGSEKKRS